MPTREQKIQRLEEAERRVISGQANLIRMEKLIARSTERGESLHELQQHLEDMQKILTDFVASRDALQIIVDALPPEIKTGDQSP